MDTGLIKIEIENITQEQTLQAQEIFHALLATGGLFGVRGGKTIIHFDKDGQFQGIELDYWPWRRRSTSGEVKYGRRNGD